MDAMANKTWKPEEEIETPYRKARQEWDPRMGSAVVQAHNWLSAAINPSAEQLQTSPSRRPTLPGAW